MADFIDDFKNKAKGFTRLYYNLLKNNPIAKAVIPEPLWAIGDYKTNDDMTLDEALRNNVSVYARATDDEEWNPKKIQDVGQEAALMFIPEVGKGRKVVNKMDDLVDWAKYKKQQLSNVEPAKELRDLPINGMSRQELQPTLDYLDEMATKSPTKEYFKRRTKAEDRNLDLMFEDDVAPTARDIKEARERVDFGRNADIGIDTEDLIRPLGQSERSDVYLYKQLLKENNDIQKAKELYNYLYDAGITKIKPNIIDMF